MEHKHLNLSAFRVRCWYQRPVAWAFALLLALLVLITFLAIASLQKIESEFLQETLVKVEKLRLLDEMVHHSRQRSVLLRDLVIASDPFVQDEINLKHSALASRYLSARNEFSVQPLDDEERQILNNIIELNSRGYAMQEKIIGLATSGQQHEALELIASELGPNREMIYPDMMKIRELLVGSSNKSTKVAVNLLESYRAALIWLFLFAIFTGIGIAWLAYKMDSRHTRRLMWQACHDSLTGLGNRYEAELQLENLIGDARKSKADHALLYLDVDQFNIINNTSGQSAGDEFLRQLAIQMRTTASNDADLNRVGSDQFIILLKGQSIDEVKSYAGMLLDNIACTRFEWSDMSYDVTASIGIVPVTSLSGSAESILSDAYLACDIAKENGGGRLQVSLESSNQTKERREGLDWASRLRRAIKEEKLVLFKQGVKSMGDGMTHSEIFVRYEADNGEIISAAQFIPAAERYNLITEIDHYVVRKTLQYMHTDNSNQSYSINLSGMSLGSRALLDAIISELDSRQVDPERVCFEITETAAIRNHTSAVQFMNVLHGLGCHFFLDDFGTGLSSFGYLRTLPLDMIKIDAHFIHNLHQDPANQSIIEAINTIAHGFGMKTIAEGVESRWQLDILSAIGIDYVQGYHIERPAPLIAA